MGLSNMPASNKGSASVPHGTRHGKTAIVGDTAKGHDPSMGGSKPNMPTKNKGNASVSLGHTKHGVGQVPGYLKGK